MPFGHGHSINKGFRQMTRHLGAIMAALMVIGSAGMVLANDMMSVKPAADAHLRMVPGTGAPAAGFATLNNDSDKDVVIVGASSPKAQRVEIHEMAMDHGVMRMRKKENLVIPAHGQVKLAPGGLHLMLFGLADDVKGGMVTVTLTTQDKNQITMPFAVTVPKAATH